MIVKNGKKTRLWKDSWLCEKPLCTLFPDLFRICENPEVTIFQTALDPQVVSFNRWLIDNLRIGWEKILLEVNKLQLTNELDVVVWKFSNNGLFNVKSVYKALTYSDADPYHKTIWKGKIPAKIKIFLWLIMNNAILTEDNMIRRQWKGSPTCYFCEQDESISHLLFQCSCAKAVWEVVAHCIGADNIPKTINQCWAW
jgi:hypothetical protein